MVSEVAHDVTLLLSPREGYRISGVYGVPDGLMAEGQDGAVSITVPTAFLSTNAAASSCRSPRRGSARTCPPRRSAESRCSR
jgi:hypothetical protein